MTDLKSILKDNNLKITEPRKALFKILSNSKTALSVREICDYMKDSNVSKSDPASVYRNLMVFDQIHLVHKLATGKYVVCREESKHQCDSLHVVFSCTSCGQSSEKGISGKILETLRKAVPDFKLTSPLTLEGKCSDCSLG